MTEELNSDVSVLSGATKGIGFASDRKTESREMGKKFIVQKTVDTKYCARFVQSFPINLPIERIDLNNWVNEMTEADYLSYSRAHKMMSSFIKDGTLYVKNLENIGIESLIQRYELKYHSPQHVQFYSSDNTAYIFRWFPARVSVPWEMYLTEASRDTCALTCLIGVDFPNLFLRAAGWFGGVGGLFLKRHLREEGKNFAKDIERKFMAKKNREPMGNGLRRSMASISN